LTAHASARLWCTRRRCAWRRRTRRTRRNAVRSGSWRDLPADRHRTRRWTHHFPWITPHGRWTWPAVGRWRWPRADWRARRPVGQRHHLTRIGRRHVRSTWARHHCRKAYDDNKGTYEGGRQPQNPHSSRLSGQSPVISSPACTKKLGDVTIQEQFLTVKIFQHGTTGYLKLSFIVQLYRIDIILTYPAHSPEHSCGG